MRTECKVHSDAGFAGRMQANVSLCISAHSYLTIILQPENIQIYLYKRTKVYVGIFTYANRLSPRKNVNFIRTHPEEKPKLTKPTKYKTRIKTIQGDQEGTLVL